MVLYEAWNRVLDFEVFDALPPSAGGNQDRNRNDLLSLKTFAEYDAGLAQASPTSWDNIRAVLYFRDSANVRWKRDRGGHLIQLRDDEWVPQDVLAEHERLTREKYQEIFPAPPET